MSHRARVGILATVVAAVAITGATLAACGVKGPPRPPTRDVEVPVPPADPASVRPDGSEAQPPDERKPGARSKPKDAPPAVPGTAR